MHTAQRHGTEKLKCEICGATFARGKGSVISTEEDGEIGICPSCHDDVFQANGRYNIDIMVVPVSEDSFKTAIRKEKYIRPEKRIGKGRPKFVAFYRGGEIGAITHISRVTNVRMNVPISKATGILRTQNPSVWMDEDYYRIFDLLKPVALRHKITRNGAPPIQNRVYKTFKQFAKARKLRDLHIRS